MKKSRDTQKEIKLVALVVTIIVLLILAMKNSIRWRTNKRSE